MPENDNVLQISDLLPDAEEYGLKAVCMGLAEGNIESYKRLYEDTDVVELYELMAVKNAVNYREKR